MGTRKEVFENAMFFPERQSASGQLTGRSQSAAAMQTAINFAVLPAASLNALLPRTEI